MKLERFYVRNRKEKAHGKKKENLSWVSIIFELFKVELHKNNYSLACKLKSGYFEININHYIKGKMITRIYGDWTDQQKVMSAISFFRNKKDYKVAGSTETHALDEMWRIKEKNILLDAASIEKTKKLMETVQQWDLNCFCVILDLHLETGQGFKELHTELAA